MININEKVKEYYNKNKNYLLYRYGEDAVQEGIMKVIENVNKNKLENINGNYINQAIKWAWLNSLKQNKYHESLEDIKGSDDDKISVEEAFGAIDKEIELSVASIDLEKTIEKMAKKNEKVIEIIKMFELGYKQNEISKATGISEPVVSRIINMKVRDRKNKRGKIDKSKLNNLLYLIKPHCIERKSYYRLKKNGYNIQIMKDGRIFSNKNLFNGEEVNRDWYVSYIDKIDVNCFIDVIKSINGGELL
jgi:RNA polymerase sigma factor (sigma-70 family)